MNYHINYSLLSLLSYVEKLNVVLYSQSHERSLFPSASSLVFICTCLSLFCCVRSRAPLSHAYILALEIKETTENVQLSTQICDKKSQLPIGSCEMRFLTGTIFQK